MNPDLSNKNKENLKIPTYESTGVERSTIVESKESIDEKLKNIEDTIYSMKNKMDKIIENMNKPEEEAPEEAPEEE